MLAQCNIILAHNLIAITYELWRLIYYFILVNYVTVSGILIITCVGCMMEITGFRVHMAYITRGGSSFSVYHALQYITSS